MIAYSLLHAREPQADMLQVGAGAARGSSNRALHF